MQKIIKENKGKNSKHENKIRLLTPCTKKTRPLTPRIPKIRLLTPRITKTRLPTLCTDFAGAQSDMPLAIQIEGEISDEAIKAIEDAQPYLDNSWYEKMQKIIKENTKEQTYYKAMKDLSNKCSKHGIKMHGLRHAYAQDNNRPPLHQLGFKSILSQVSLLATPCYKPIANQLPNNKKDIKDKDWRKVK
jgi:hypothetical protein